MPDFNTDKNVYLLGAGFSKEIGLPLQDDFLLVAKEVYFKNPGKFKHFETVFKYQNDMARMRHFLNYPLLNLEHLFNLIEMDLFYSKSPEIAGIKNDLKKLICDVLIDKTPNPFTHGSTGDLMANPTFDNYLSFLSLFIREYDKSHIATRTDSIISFNYDLVIEGAASLYNWRRTEGKPNIFGDIETIRFNTTFGKGNITVDKLPNYFTQNRPDTYFADNLEFSEAENTIKIIKLHGSISWKDLHNGETFIVPPTWNKYDERIRKLWEVAYKEIVSAERIIIIGYSFPETDTYVKSLLALGLNENKIIQKIIFINPDEDATKKTCIDMLDKYFQRYCTYKGWRFSTFIGTAEGRTFIKEHLDRQVRP